MLDYLVLIFSLLLITLPSLFDEGSGVFRLLFLIPFLFVIFENLLNLYILKKNYKNLTLLLIVLSLQSFALIRTSLNEMINFYNIIQRLVFWIVITVFTFGLFLNTRRGGFGKSHLLKGIYYSLSLYVFVNVILHLMGITNSRNIYIEYMFRVKAILPSLLGITSYRILFPLASGINSFGLVAGASLVASFVFVFSRRVTGYQKTFAIVFMLSSLYTLLLSDSRGGQIYSMLVIVFITFLPSKWTISARWIPFIMPFFTLISTFILNSLSLTFLAMFSRTGDVNQSLTLSSRTVIWNLAIDKLSDFSFIDLIGYGYAGPFISGLAHFTDYLKSNYLTITYLPLHNYFLESVFGIGYVGTIFVIFLQSNILCNLSRCWSLDPENTTYKMMFGVFLYLVILGLTESAPTVDTIELFTIFLYVSVASIFLPITSVHRMRPD